MIVFNIKHDEVRTGCFVGTLLEFINAVEKRYGGEGNSIFLKEYRAVIALFTGLSN